MGTETEEDEFFGSLESQFIAVLEEDADEYFRGGFSGENPDSDI